MIYRTKIDHVNFVHILGAGQNFVVILAVNLEKSQPGLWREGIFYKVLLLDQLLSKSLTLP